MSANLGAHEVMELHEILTGVVDSINQFELYKPHVTDQQLGSILDKQLQFMNQEYNNLTQALTTQTGGMGVPYRSPKTTQPKYGLNNPQPLSPSSSPQQLEDRDVASGMLGSHKSSAIVKSMAALECADPNLRRMILQSSNNCSEMAYEVWQFMNQKGYYQVPTMKQMTTNTMTHNYSPSPNMTQEPGRVPINNPDFIPQ